MSVVKCDISLESYFCLLSVIMLVYFVQKFFFSFFSLKWTNWYSGISFVRGVKYCIMSAYLLKNGCRDTKHFLLNLCQSASIYLLFLIYLFFSSDSQPCLVMMWTSLTPPLILTLCAASAHVSLMSRWWVHVSMCSVRCASIPGLNERKPAPPVERDLSKMTCIPCYPWWEICSTDWPWCVTTDRMVVRKFSTWNNLMLTSRIVNLRWSRAGMNAV